MKLSGEGCPTAGTCLYAERNVRETSIYKPTRKLCWVCSSGTVTPKSISVASYVAGGYGQPVLHGVASESMAGDSGLLRSIVHFKHRWLKKIQGREWGCRTWPSFWSVLWTRLRRGVGRGRCPPGCPVPFCNWVGADMDEVFKVSFISGWHWDSSRASNQGGLSSLWVNLYVCVFIDRQLNLHMWRNHRVWLLAYRSYIFHLQLVTDSQKR